MSIACVLNTSALKPGSDTQPSSGGQPYGNRAWLLRNLILPWYASTGIFSEIVVVGEFEPGPGYRYLHFDSVYHNCADALLKRQVGFEALKRTDVEWVLFQHDDHLYDPMNPYPTSLLYDADVLSPRRYTRARSSVGEPLNDGSGAGYVNGHACLMRPSCFEQGFRWDTLPPLFTWDIEMTRGLDRLNLTWLPASTLKVWDCEYGATPWK